MCQDSPCPVCRYDHSGLNDALSQCQICGTTENNYVCLICGAVSCGGAGSVARVRASHSANSLCAHGGGEASDALSTTTSTTTTATATPQAVSQMSHARQHYNKTLHAYALETETQHVWDFAGQGFVHRLMQNKDDGKLVEVNDPNNMSSAQRPLNPGLSDSQEGEVMHRKLESFANQYYTLLKSQLEQQRIFYEGRLEEVRREYGRAKPPGTVDLLTALKQERHQLSQRLESLKSKCRKIQDDLSGLRGMSESLESNKLALQQQLEQVQFDRLETSRMFEECLPPLQEKVTTLMLQLESESHGVEEQDQKRPARRR